MHSGSREEIEDWYLDGSYATTLLCDDDYGGMRMTRCWPLPAFCNDVGVILNAS